MKKIIIENTKTIIYALFIAIIIRSLIIQPFYIPSSSMEPNLLIGDRIFVTKYSYGYSKHSFPFSLPILKNKLFEKDPERGDLVVFKTPLDNRTDYIKRIIGLEGDTIQFIDGDLYFNNKKIILEKIASKRKIRCGPYDFEHSYFKENLINDKTYVVVYRNQKSNASLKTIKFTVPKDHYFFLGDNRDCSNDSRIDVGYVNKINVIGKARFIFFSNDTIKGSVLKIWNWKNSFRFDRFFKKL